ncbi:HNH endonuclease [uncultured Paraglaciecola sp.]|uniref:HNH endonuclease n=1 Tax=uncultured Paraglaciecola sp. TaxID=1765024 RepID=UPI0030DB6648|tara:strand:- start:96911 stop:97750 length:840 start_codon:yes stop_codon:yes gene_type:complete
MEISNSDQQLIDLKPTSHRKIIELVEEAGIDVSDWANFKGGAEKASMNPKYCYEWFFEDKPENITVLNLWFDNCEVLDGVVVQKLNMRQAAEELKGIKKRRAYNMDFSLQNAARLKTAVRVIICDENPKLKKEGEKSTADRRHLDPINWFIKEYDGDGNCILQRGEIAAPYIDQFTLRELEIIQPEKIESTSFVYPRSKAVRDQVLFRAKGSCEHCGEKGFRTNSGALYLESHHIIPLSEEGIDHISNVIALCPNHHREAHFSENASALRTAFLSKVSS